MTNKNNKLESQTQITLIADSGATDHFVNKGIKSNINKDEIIILKNVISAENISENLISLRRFADVGLGIYLDDEILKIFNKNTGAEYITGKYEKPNWVISLEVDNE